MMFLQCAPTSGGLDRSPGLHRKAVPMHPDPPRFHRFTLGR